MELDAVTFLTGFFGVTLTFTDGDVGSRCGDDETGLGDLRGSPNTLRTCGDFTNPFRADG